MERRVHVHDRAHAVSLGVQLCELELTLLGLLEVNAHLQSARPERDLEIRAPVPVVLDVERLDARHRLREPLRIVQDLPHRLPWRAELPLSFDLHVDTTSTPARDASGSCRRDHTR